MTDDRRNLVAYGIVVLVLVGAFYALILNPFELREGTEAAIIGFVGAALQWAFGNAVASSTARNTSAALMSTPPSNGATAAHDGTTSVGG
jgi:hypothetical protein